MEIEIIQYIKLDMVSREQTPRIYAKQGDTNSRVARITLHSNGLAWTPPTGATFAVRYKKEDGTGGLYDELSDGTAAVTKSSNDLIVNLAPQVLAASGDVHIDIVIIAGANIIATFNFIVCVQESPISNADLESQDYYKVASLEQINAALDARVKTVNGIAPDDSGNVQVENTGGSIVLDATLTQTGKAADAKAVGDKIDLLAEDVQEHNHAIRELTEKKLDSTGGIISGGLSVQDALSVGTPESGFYIVSEPGAATSPKMQLYGADGDQPVRIGGIATPVSIGDAATKGYVDSAVDAVSKLPGISGRGIVAVARTTGDGLAGTVDTYTITYTDDTTSTFTVRNGANGEDGADGADGGYYTPSVAVDGTLSWAGSKSGMPSVQSANIKGAPGANGRGIVSVTRTTGDGSAGTVDTYTITYTDGTTSTFQVRNGANGADGANGTNGGYYTPSVSDDGTLVFMASKQGMPPVVPIDLHEYISAVLPGGYCSTGAAVADKIESYISKEIAAGSLVTVQFVHTNTAAAPTLTVNGVKAAIVGGNGEAISPAMLGTGERVFLYTTSQKWLLLNPQSWELPAATAADAGKMPIVGSDGQYGLSYPQMPVVETTENNVVMQPNVKYQWGVVSSLTINFSSAIPGIVNEYCGEFVSSDPATNFVCPLSVNWVTPLNIEVGKHYEFSIINGIGVMAGV